LIDEKSLAARVEAALIQEIPSVEVEVKEGQVFIYLKRSVCGDEELISRIKRLAASIADVEIRITCLVKPQLP
jgi:hypothetical protein